MSDAGATMQRAEDKIAQMQARAGAIDELLASGALTDLGSSTDDIQAKLNKVSATSQVELRARRAEDRTGARPPAADAAPGTRPIADQPPVPRPRPTQLTQPEVNP